jgi:hypothetical protein
MKRTACRIFVGKPEGRRALRRPRHRWEYIIKMDVSEIGWGGIEWIDVAQDRDQWKALVNMVINFCVPYSVGKFMSS